MNSTPARRRLPTLSKRSARDSIPSRPRKLAPRIRLRFLQVRSAEFCLRRQQLDGRNGRRRRTLGRAFETGSRKPLPARRSSPRPRRFPPSPSKRRCLGKVVRRSYPRPCHFPPSPSKRACLGVQSSTWSSFFMLSSTCRPPRPRPRPSSSLVPGRLRALPGVAIISGSFPSNQAGSLAQKPSWPHGNGEFFQNLICPYSAGNSHPRWMRMGGWGLSSNKENDSGDSCWH